LLFILPVVIVNPLVVVVALLRVLFVISRGAASVIGRLVTVAIAAAVFNVGSVIGISVV